jgi:PAS domain S-box-containing protein
MIRSQANAADRSESDVRSSAGHRRGIAYMEELENGRVISIGADVEDIFGYPQEEWLGTDLWVTLLHPDDRDRVVQGFIDLDHQADEPFIAEYRMIARDGRVVWIRDEAVLVRGSFAQALCWHGTMYVFTPEHAGLAPRPGDPD